MKFGLTSVGALALCALAGSSGCVGEGDPGAPQGASSASVRVLPLLAATYGVDNFGGLFQCAGVPGVDGVPVVTREPLVASTVQPEDFVVVNAQGERVVASCATLAPAVNTDERRTILLQGAFGTPGTNEPVRVEVVGDVRVQGGGSLAGASVAVTPFDVGQYLVYARPLDVSQHVGGVDQCPAQSGGATTRQVVQLAFGSNAGNSFPAEASYRARFVATLADGRQVSPIAFGDTTGDNYLELCLDDTAPAVSVRIAAGTVPDASDQLNAETSVTLEE